MKRCSYRRYDERLPIMTCTHPRVHVPREVIWPGVCEACRFADGGSPYEVGALAKKASSTAARGLGDTVANLLSAMGIRKRPGCGCGQRQERLNRWWPYRRAKRPELNARPSVLFRFPHGFGDAVQLTVVLRHLQRLRPEWQVDVACKSGMETLFAGLCRRAIVCSRGHEFDASQVADSDDAVQRTLHWAEPWGTYGDSPSTKAERCLREEFGLRPIEALCRYRIAVGEHAAERAEQYLSSLAGRHRGRYPIVLLHYQGNSARSRKNLDEQVARDVVATVRRHGLLPVVLDFETPRRSRLVRDEGVACPGVEHRLWQGTGTGDGETIAALIGRVALMVGIDSGPGHVAGATDTPTLIVWRRHHPVQYYALADNVTHVVPSNHAKWVAGEAEPGLRYFERRYRYRVFEGHLRFELPQFVGEQIAGLR